MRSGSWRLTGNKDIYRSTPLSGALQRRARSRYSPLAEKASSRAGERMHRHKILAAGRGTMGRSSVGAAAKAWASLSGLLCKPQGRNPRNGRRWDGRRWFGGVWSGRAVSPPGIARDNAHPCRQANKAVGGDKNHIPPAGTLGRPHAAWAKTGPRTGQIRCCPRPGGTDSTTAIGAMEWPSRQGP